jgi:tryptophan-rich sensory protein
MLIVLQTMELFVTLLEVNHGAIFLIIQTVVPLKMDKLAIMLLLDYM